ncbi:MAG TPA: peptidoglycan-binding domain-containing protein [Burkholderiales bacterium]|jgi:peptidoglycan hydrolase-like protein with peptidoglycan-binding domain|nr:peptidoglycan-binding domain-containing protein [Burkholderiales bacterium]
MKTVLHLAVSALIMGASLSVLADSPGPYTEFYKQLQQKLNDLGFDAGPVNGDFSDKTQAALAQYQLAMMLPASGMPDAPTLLALDLQTPDLEANATSPDENAAAGGTR